MNRKLFLGFPLLVMTTAIFTGCKGLRNSFIKNSDSPKEEVKIRTNETIIPESKWINSTIDGAIDLSTKVDAKDDFYTFVNKDWILEQKVSKDDFEVSTISSSDRITNKRLLNILNNVDDPKADGNVYVPAEVIEYDQKLVTTFAAAASDWNARNAAGVEPLKKYLGYIENIKSVDDLKEYFYNKESQNLFNINLASMEITVMPMDSQTNYVLVSNAAPMSLPDTSVYTGGSGFIAKTFTNLSILNLLLKDFEDKYGYIFERLGYSRTEWNRIFRKCFKFECGLADHKGNDSYYASDWISSEKSLKTTDLSAIKKMEKNYPLAELLELYGYDSGKIIIINPSYIKYLGRAVKKSNLDEIKAYLMVQTVINSGSLLDRDCCNKLKENAGNKDKKPSKDDDDKQLINLVQKNLAGCLDTIYISRYCKTEEKQDLSQMTEEIIQKYHQIIDEEDWLADKTKAFAHEKLDFMIRNVLYPDTFESYEYYNFEGDTSLLDIIADINAQGRGADSRLIGKEVNRSYWNLNENPTTTNNCYHLRQNNSINIFAGFISGDTYDISMSEEQKLARIGAVIGHEVSHALDAEGILYDKYGNMRGKLPVDEITAFTMRTEKLSDYYSALKAYPGASKLKGSVVKNEAIADMGGMKCVLAIAKDIKDFDYDDFFKAFEQLWREKATFNYEETVANDVHPVNCLRGNVTVMQFDEFNETYNVQKGDGMYMAPDKRISVW